jgi:hypothetical protein
MVGGIESLKRAGVGRIDAGADKKGENVWINY